MGKLKYCHFIKQEKANPMKEKSFRFLLVLKVFSKFVYSLVDLQIKMLSIVSMFFDGILAIIIFALVLV